jgi:hypothetical protein
LNAGLGSRFEDIQGRGSIWQGREEPSRDFAALDLFVFQDQFEVALVRFDSVNPRLPQGLLHVRYSGLRIVALDDDFGDQRIVVG